MKKKNNLLNIWGILTIAALTSADPALANEFNPTAQTDYFEGQNSIEIYVPPPENPNPANPVNPGVCAASLEPTINSIIGKYPNSWGILVESVADGTVLYSHNSDKFFIPASNAKIITTAAALQKLSAQASIGKKSLKEWVNVTNLFSNNYYADTLLRYIGGANAVRDALNQLGINPNGYRVADGSGLSRKNATTPRTLISILRAMYYAPQRDVFYASLPVAGISGTLRNRMRQTPAQGNVAAKTGTLNGVRALSGYLNHPQYGVLAFSIIANNPSVSGSALVSSIDKIVVQLRTFTPCQP